MNNIFNILSASRKQKIWNFPGGIYPSDMKSQSNNMPLRYASLPDKMIIPLRQHLGINGTILVKPGDEVLRGQPLTTGIEPMLPVHAPTSGRIEAIIPYRIVHSFNLDNELCVILLPDNKDQWISLKSIPDFHKYSSTQLLNQIHNSGIVGLGGAGFPTKIKLNYSANRLLDTLIINGAECEPYITADDILMREHAYDIVKGIDILNYILKPRHLIIGIEDNKSIAINALQKALKSNPIGQLYVIPTKYPSGSSKQLIKVLTGKEVPFGKHASDIGITVLNVGTVYAIKRAIIDGEALTERVVTLTGGALARPGNIWVRLGTPVSHLLIDAGFKPDIKEHIVIMGGPITGLVLPSLDVPIVKTSNCILAPSVKELEPVKPEQNCIRCGKCSDVCPAKLLPQQLYWFSRGQEYDKSRKYHLFDCIECGACAYVCPSNIPLVKYYRQQKAEIRAIDNNAKRASMNKARYEAKLTRLKLEKQQRLISRYKNYSSKIDNTNQTARNPFQTAVIDAIARAKERRKNMQKIRISRNR